MVPFVFAHAEVDSYLAAFRAGRIRWPRACPHCGGRLHKHGVYERKAETAGRFLLVPIQRMRCSACRRTCSFLPTCFAPYRSLLTPEREHVAAALAEGRACAA